MTASLPILPRARGKDRARPRRLTASEVRTIVRHRDGYQCRLCGMTARSHWKRYRRKLDVHRLVPGSRYTIRGCITVCRPCHGPLPKSSSKSRPGGGQRGAPVSVYLSPELNIALERYMASLRPCPSLSGIVAASLEDFLRKHDAAQPDA